MNTRFMERIFSAMEKDEKEITNQVAADIEAAKENGIVDTDELTYTKNDNGDVEVLDKGTGELTVVESDGDEEGSYEIYNPADVDEQIEGYLHPEGDGVTPGQQYGVDMEDVSENHLNGMPISELVPPTCPEDVIMDAEVEGEVREFSVTSDNVIIQRIFSDQVYCERLFSEVIESESTAIVGDLKIEKDPNEENTVIVTSESTGDQARVILDDEEMEVTELESRNFNEISPIYVVGVDSFNHVIVDSPVYGDPNELAQLLAERGVEAIQFFDNIEESREYAFALLTSLGAGETEEEIVENLEEPVQAEYSDVDIYLTKFYSNHTEYMDKLFSEAVNDIEISQVAIEDAIQSGDQIETDTEIVTPIDSDSAIVEDKETGEFTLVTLEGEDMELDPISEDEAEELTSNLVTDGKEVDEDKSFSELDYCNEAETRFFSENEDVTDYMVKLYSEEVDQDEIEDAIQSGDQIETDTEVITPISSESAIIEDKETGEFTKATLEGDFIDVVPISEEEADDLTSDLVVEGDDEDSEPEEVIEEKKEEEVKEFSTLDKYFSQMIPAQPQVMQMQPQVMVEQPMVQQAQPQVMVEQPVVQAAPSLELIEDHALSAIQSIQEVTNEAVQAISTAKEAPVVQAGGDLREATFSEGDNEIINDTFISWLGDHKLRK